MRNCEEFNIINLLVYYVFFISYNKIISSGGETTVAIATGCPWPVAMPASGITEEEGALGNIWCGGGGESCGLLSLFDRDIIFILSICRMSATVVDGAFII
jgi:hypothetical protein